MKLKKNIYYYLYYTQIGERNKAKKQITNEIEVADYKWVQICRKMPVDLAWCHVVGNSECINDPLLEKGAWRSVWDYNTWNYWIYNK